MFSFPPTETLPLLNTNSPFSPPQPLELPLYILPMNLSTLGTSGKWNHTAFVLLHLAYFTHSHILKVHSCHMGQNFISFMVNIVLYRYTTFCLSISPLMTPGLLLLSNLVKTFFD